MSIEVVNSPYVFGIDLGTSNSAIAVFINGESRIIPIDGEKTLPSVVSVRSDGEVMVGRQARNRLLLDPKNTVASVKREMGVEGPPREFEGRPGQQYTPADLSALILEKLRVGAEQAGVVDLQGTPKDVVICIPANFNDVQKNATREAGILAGLNVIWLLAEPVAASIAYAVDREREQTILVYDLGGGTFDVSILRVDSARKGPPELKVLAYAGIQQLGGDDFDNKLMEIASAHFEEVSQINILDLKKDQGVAARQLRDAQQKLKFACETAKIELSTAQSARIELPNLIRDESGDVHNLDMEITRQEFDDAIRELISQSREAVQRALDGAKMTIEDISRIVLVGGSTRIPLVREMLTEMFGKEPYSDTDPDTVVARGAAVFGNRLRTPAEVGETPMVTNIVTHYLGIETYGGGFSCLIEKGVEIPESEPLRATRDFATSRDNQVELAIHVYQGEEKAEYVGDKSMACIGEFFLTGIPEAPAGRERATVTFEIDQQNLLRVSASGSSSAGNLDIKRM